MVLDARERQGLLCVRRLAAAGIAVAALDSSPDAPAFASRLCAATGQVPDCAQDPAGFVDAIIGWLEASSARAVITVGDGSIEALREHREEVERRAALALADEDSLAVATSKARTLMLARELGVRIPRSVPVHGPGDVSSAVAEVGLPLVIKPTVSWNQSGHAGVRLTCLAAATAQEASAGASAVWSSGGEPILQEWIPGRREAVSLLRTHGKLNAMFAQVAARMYPPLGGSSVVRTSIPVPADTAAAACRLVDGCGLDGYSEIEFRRDFHGNPVLMEINPRLSASIELAVRAGVDFPLMLYRWATGAPVPTVTGYRTGVRMRWLGGDILRLREVLTHPGRPDTEPRGQALWSFLRDFARPAYYDYVTLRDPMPAAVATRGLARNVTRDWVARIQSHRRRLP